MAWLDQYSEVVESGNTWTPPGDATPEPDEPDHSWLDQQSSVVTDEEWSRVAPDVLTRTPRPLPRYVSPEEKDWRRAGELLSSVPSVIREPVVGLASTGASIMSAVSRPVSKEIGDYFAKIGENIGHSGEAARGGDWSPWLSRMLSGAVRSASQAGILAPSGLGGMTLGFGATEANQALYEAEQAGITGNERLKYAAVQGAIEGTIMSVFNRIGLPGFEGLVGQVGSGVMKNVGKQFLVATAQEVPEELLTELAHAVAESTYGVNPQALDGEQLGQRMIDTVAQTVLTVGLTSGAGRLAQNREMIETLEGVRQKGFVSEKDGEQLGLSPEEMTNRATRKKAVDDRINQIEQEISDEVRNDTPPQEEAQGEEVRPGSDGQVEGTQVPQPGVDFTPPADAEPVIRPNELDRMSELDDADLSDLLNSYEQVVTPEEFEILGEIADESRRIRDLSAEAPTAPRKAAPVEATEEPSSEPITQEDAAQETAQGETPVLRTFTNSRGETRTGEVTRETDKTISIREGDGTERRMMKKAWKEQSEASLPKRTVSAEQDGVQESDQTPDVQLAKEVAASIGKGKAIDKSRFHEIAESVYGGTRAEGAYDPSRANDALELGVNLHIAESSEQEYASPSSDATTAKGTIEALNGIRDSLPPQTNRSGLKDTAQQFSTPPAYAYAVNWIANLGKGDTVLEPSAGTGSLAVHAKRAGATVYVNELAEVDGQPNRRAELIREIGADQVFTEDAEQIHNVLAGKIQPTVVVMNPPFSTAAGRMKGKKLVGTDLKHIDAALNLLAPEGRVVAIIGAGLHGKSKGLQKWEDGLRAKGYDLKADIELSRDVYKGYGTTFPTRVLVIDKAKYKPMTVDLTESPGAVGTLAAPSPLTGKAEDLFQLIDMMEGVRNERTAITQPTKDRPASEEGAGESERRRNTAPPVPSPTGKVDSGGRSEVGTSGGSRTGERTSSGGRPRPDVRPDSTQSEGDAAGTGLPEGDQRGRGAASERAGRNTGAEVGGKPVSEPSQPEPDDGPTTQLDVAEPKKRRAGELTDSVYEAYEPRRVRVKGAKPHPASVVESAAMSAIDPPAIDYAPNLPKETVESGALSEIQLEAIAYAGYAHGQQIEVEGDTFRKGFMVGDGTGIGKGRTAAGIILDNFRQGRKKAIWVSKNQELMADSKEYSEAVGLPADSVFSHGKVKSGVEIESGDGILYSTYNTLAGTASPKAVAAGNERSRLDQIIDWVGEDFDGAIVFDEAHIMRNAVDTKGGRGMKKASKVALSGVELQRRLPNARVVYMSATAATEVANLAYAVRLGLWGKGTPFANQEEFSTAITAGGVAAMEKVAADMKAMGLYVSRNISFNDGTEEGTVSYRRLEHTLTPDEEAVYDKMAEAWGIVFSNMNEALKETGGDKDGGSVSQARGAFWGANQRFWNNMLTSLQTPAVIKDMEKAINDGRSVVIQLTNTNEAANKRALAERGEDQSLEDIDTSPRGILMDFVEKSFPVWQYEEYTDDSGNVRSQPVVDANGSRVKNASAVQMQEQLMDELGSIQLGSRGSIDMILDHFGAKNVAEITGRSFRLVKDNDGKLKKESRSKSKTSSDIKAFQDGRKTILVFSEAGGTGASYHANLSEKNQQPRTHYLLQAGWRADVAVQGLGRTHRSNQAQAPAYVLVHTNLKGQKRFISTIARRLSQLGAITKGERQAVTGGEDAALFTAADNLESTEAKQALRRFYDDAMSGQIEGVSMEMLEERLGLALRDANGNQKSSLPPITQFLNRVLSLPVNEQNIVFEAFESRLQEQVEIAQSRGELDQGIETVRADRITKESDTVVHTHESGAETRHVKVTVARKSNPTQWKDVGRKSFKPVEFYVRSQKTGKVMAVAPTGTSEVDTKTGSILSKARVISPTGVTYGYVERLKNENFYDQLNNTEAEAAWGEAVDAIPEFTETEENFLTGVLLPIWNRIPGENTRVMRMMTDEGEMILGRQIPAEQVGTTLRALGASVDTPDLTPQQAIDAVMGKNNELRLANGWSVQRRRVGGENRIEVVGPSFVHHGELEAAGVFWERIQSKTRYFVPTGSAEAMEGVLSGRPITDVIGRTSTFDEGEGVAKMDSPAPVPTRQSRSTEPRGDVDKVGIAATDIQKTVERMFGVAIRQGGFSVRASGIYKWMTGRSSPPSPEVIRTAEDHYANLAVVAHEVAHHIDETLKVVKGMPSEVRTEVRRLDYEPEKGRAFEGWAEFLRRYITEPPVDVDGKEVPNPGIDVPQTLAWFEDIFLVENEQTADSVRKFREYAQEFAQQSVFQRVGSLIADRAPEDLSFRDRWVDKRRRWTNRLKSDFIDKFHTLQWIQERARQLGHAGIGIYDLTMAHFLSASSNATIAFEEGVRSIRTDEKIGSGRSLWSLRDHLESDQEYEDAVRYALARHTVFMHKKNPKYKTGLDIHDANALLDEVESSGQADRFKEFAEGLAQFNDDLIVMLVNAGALPAREARKMINAYGGLNYFPLHRVQDTERGMFAGSGAGFVNLGRAVPGRSRKGSGRQIIDPLDATVARAIKFYGRAIQARQSHVLAETLDPKLGGVGGMGGLMDRVDPKKTVHRGTVKEILGTLVAEGVVQADDAKAMRIAARILDPTESGLPGQRAMEWFAGRHGIEPNEDGDYSSIDMEEAAAQEPDAMAMISLWRPDYTPSSQKRTVVIYTPEGKPLMYEMDADLYETASGMDSMQFGPFMSVMRETMRYFKGGAVGFSTGFGTANLLRDYWEFQGKARHTKGLDSLGKPPVMLGRYIAAKAHKMAGDKSADPLVRLFEETGGKVYSVIGHDVDSRRRYRRRRIGTSTMSKLGLSVARPKDSAESALQGLQEVIAISDAPPRLADMEASLKEDGYVVRDGRWFDETTNEFVDHLPEHSRIKASIAAAEATINFKRIGSKSQHIEPFVPFFNATVQAMYRQYTQVKGLKSLGKKDVEGMRAKRYVVYLSALAATGVAYWLLRHDDDDWREQDSYLRDGYWTWGENGATYIRIPKPRDTAVVSNVVENMLDAWYRDDSRSMSDVVMRDFGARLPTGGGFVRGAIESYVADYDYFRERSLTPEYMKDLPKEQQITPYTNSVSEALGQVTGKYLNTSPIQLQHLLNSSSGGLYGRMVDTYDAWQEDRLGPEHIPFLRGVVIDRHQARSINDFYTLMKDASISAAREEAAEGTLSDSTVKKLAVIDEFATMMTKIRQIESKVGKRRSFEYQPYITGLARHALGYEELETSPNPLFDRDAPAAIRALAKDYAMRAVNSATGEVTDEDSRLSALRGRARMEELNLTPQQALELLRDYHRRPGRPQGDEYIGGTDRLEKGYMKRAIRLAEMYMP